MKTLSCLRPGFLEYVDRGIPPMQNNHALLKIKRIGICGTDLHAFEGTQPYFEYPRVLGHELAAEIVDIDNSTGFAIGEDATIIPYFNCGHCAACLSGNPNYCVNVSVCGVHIDGGMAEYLSVPSASLVHGNGLGLDELALIEPLAIGAHGVTRANVKPGEFVLVVGAGPIGLAAMEFARIAGAKVIALDLEEQKLQFCRDKLKVYYAINARSAAIEEQLYDITGGSMASVVIDATGNLSAINNSFLYMSHGARYVLIGLQKGNIQFNHPEFHKREGTLMSSRNALRADFDHVMDSLKKGLIDPLAYITHRAQFDEVRDSFESWLTPETGVIKAMVSLD